MQISFAATVGHFAASWVILIGHKPPSPHFPSLPTASPQELDQLRKHALQSAMAHLSVLRSRSLLHSAFMVWRGRALAAKSRSASPSQSHELHATVNQGLPSRLSHVASAAKVHPPLSGRPSLCPDPIPQQYVGSTAQPTSAGHQARSMPGSSAVSADTLAVDVSDAMRTSHRARLVGSAALDYAAGGLDVLGRVAPVHVAPRVRSRSAALDPASPVSPSMLMQHTRPAASSMPFQPAAIFHADDAPIRQRAAPHLPVGISQTRSAAASYEDPDVAVCAVITAAHAPGQTRPGSRAPSARRSRSGSSKPGKRAGDGQPQGGGILDALEAVDALLDSCFSPRSDARPPTDKNARAASMLNRTAGGSRMATSPRSLLGARGLRGSWSGPGTPPEWDGMGL